MTRDNRDDATTAASGSAPSPSGPPARAWQRMLSGRRLDLLKPDPADFAIEDIAHGLARVARWNGQTHGNHAFSVAQHSLVVADICEALAPDWDDRWHLAALLHDGPEFVIGDLISPFKAAVGGAYKDIEQRLLSAMHVRFGLPAELPHHVTATIKTADGVAAFYEATRLAGFTPDEAVIYFATPPDLPPTLRATLETLEAIPTEDAQRRFLARFAALDP